jgi:hypothetical protein
MSVDSVVIYLVPFSFEILPGCPPQLEACNPQPVIQPSHQDNHPQEEQLRSSLAYLISFIAGV